MLEGPVQPSALVRRLVISLLREPQACVSLRTGELDLALRLLRRLHLLGRLAMRLQSFGLIERLPPEAAEQLISALAVIDARERVTRWELNRLEWALRGLKNVRVLVVKGCAYLLGGLPNASGRIFADVDLLVAERDLERALIERGWRGADVTPYDDNYYRVWTHELPPMVHAEREIEVDLHFTIIPRMSRLKPRPEYLLEEARPLPHTLFWRLSDVDLVLHTMTHLMFDSDLADSLRDLVDIDDLLKYFSAGDPAFFERLWARAETLDLSRPAFYSLRYAQRLLGTSVPDEVLQRSRRGAPTALIVRLMDALVPRALFPQHPDSPSATAGLARLLLYVRSQWIRLPPLLLARHLIYKTYLRRFGGAHAPAATQPPP